MNKNQGLQVLTVTINRIMFRKSDSGWGIYKTDQGTAKGVLSWDVGAGEEVQLHGWWATSSYNGEKEFTFSYGAPYLPTSSIDLLSYACKRTDGLGPARAILIWERYGEDWRKARDLDIPGITAQIRKAWQGMLDHIENDQERSVAVAWLMAKGCSVKMAVAAWEEWKFRTVPAIRQDPFQLAYLPNFGFPWVDREVRPQFAIDDDDPRRLDAAVMYALAQCLGTGSTLVDADTLAAKAREYVVLEDPAANLGRLRSAGRIRLLEEASTAWVCRSKHFKAETLICERFGVAA